MDSITEQLFKKCTDLFDKVIKRKSDDFLGTPPKVFYIDYGVFGKRMIGYGVIDGLETYRYENGVLEQVEPGTERHTEPVSGMYHPEGYAAIGISADQCHAFFEYVLGPLNGRGFFYEIIKDEDGFKLGEERTLWVS